MYPRQVSDTLECICGAEVLPKVSPSCPWTHLSHLRYIQSVEITSKYKTIDRAVARSLIGGGCIFIYSGSARLASFEINFISKETSRAEPEYMSIHPPN